MSKFKLMVAAEPAAVKRLTGDENSVHKRLTAALAGGIVMLAGHAPATYCIYCEEFLQWH